MQVFFSRVRSFSQWPIFAKTVFSSVLIIVMIVLSFAFYFMPRIEANVIDNKQRGLRNALECVVTQVEHLHNQVEAGYLSLEEAQQKAVEIVSVTRFNGMRDYMYANDLQGYCRASVVQENIGTFVANSTDYFGQDTHQTYVGLAMSPEQGGYTFFSWMIKDPAFRDSILVTRMYCMEFFEPWGWYFVNGMSYVDPRIDDDIRSEIRALRNTFFMVLFLIALVALFITYLVADYIRRRVLEMARITRQVSEGNLEVSLHFENGSRQGREPYGQPEKHEVMGSDAQIYEDEIGQMGSALGMLLKGLKAKAQFARKIGEGKLDTSFEQLGKDDVLGAALLDMRQNLVQAREEEQKRKQEDEKRNWVTQGLAQFADILRSHTHNMEQLCFETIKSLIHYINANQGGVFVWSDQNRREGSLELVACYAFDRKKFMAKSVLPGEGLIGAVFLEKEMVYMTDIPQDYVKITSGLGGANPDVLVIVPLVFNEKVYGVMELASFHRLESYQLDFIKKVAENMASTLSTVQIGTQTSLLLEQSQQQAEEMKAQEEEMRQNLEEMQATQEEMMRKEKTLVENQQTLDTLCAVLEYDAMGYIRYCNPRFASLIGSGKEEVEGRNLSDFFVPDTLGLEDLNDYFAQLRNGKTQPFLHKRKGKKGDTVWLKGVARPVTDTDGTIKKIIEVSVDVTDLTKG